MCVGRQPTALGVDGRQAEREAGAGGEQGQVGARGGEAAQVVVVDRIGDGDADAIGAQGIDVR